MSEYRNIRRAEWLHAWHYTRDARRRGCDCDHIGPLLRMAVREVLRQSGDRLAVRAEMARLPGGGPLTAFLYTSRAGFLSSLNK